MASLLGVLSGRFMGSGVQVTVAGSPLADVGGAVLVESIAGVFLVARTSASAFSAVDAVCSHQSCTITGTATFSAVEAVCTHEGCTVSGAEGDIYVCPCHGSRYNRAGQVVHGPAMASLRRFSTTVADGVVTIAL